jgi:hypothetical protein
MAALLGVFVSYWFGSAWILLLSARIFADIDIGWPRSLLAVFVALFAEALVGCGVSATLAGDNATGIQALAANALPWLVWAGSIAWIARLGPRDMVITILGMTGIFTALGYAVTVGGQLVSS